MEFDSIGLEIEDVGQGLAAKNIEIMLVFL